MIGLDSTDVGGCCVLNTQDGSPNRGIVHGDRMVPHGGLEHRVDDQIEAHPRAVSGNRALPERDHRELLVGQLHRRLLSLKLRNAIGIIGADRPRLVIQIILRIAIDRAGRCVDVPLHLGILRRVRQICGCRRVENEILARRKFRHRIVRESRKKNHLVIRLQVVDRELKNILVQRANLARQMVTKPEQIDHVDFVASVEQFWDEDAADIARAPGDRIFIVFLREIMLRSDFEIRSSVKIVGFR